MESLIRFLKSNWKSVLIAVPTVLLAIGVIIRNIYLANLGLWDFAILNAEGIITGIVYVGTLIVLFVYNNDALHHALSFSPGFIRLLWKSLRKLVSLSVIVFIMLFRPTFTIFQNEKVNGMFTVSFYNYCLGYIVCMFLLHSPLRFADQQDKWMKKWKKRIKIVVLILDLLAIIMVVVFWMYYHQFRDLLGYFVPLVVILPILIYIGQGVFLEQKANNYFGTNENQRTLDEIREEESKSLTNRIFNYVLIFILAIFLSINTYATKIYPMMPRSFGGGRTQQAMIHLNNDDQMIVQIIDINAERVLAFVEDETITIISWDTIDSIENMNNE